MALTHLYTGTVRTGPLPVTVNVYSDDGETALADATGDPASLVLGTGNKLWFGRPETAYGLTLLPSHVELNLRDPKGDLRSLFASLDDEDAYLVELTAPAHALTNNLPFRWLGRPMREGRSRTIAPRVRPAGTFTLRAYDGLGRLSRQDGAPLKGYSRLDFWIRDVLGAVNRHLRVVWKTDAWPSNAHDGGTIAAAPGYLRFAEEITEQAGNYGTRKEQVERFLGNLGLVVYQHPFSGLVTPAAGDPLDVPSLYAVHRSHIGGEIADALLYGTGSTPAAAVAADALDVPAGWVSQGDVETVNALDHVRVSAGGNLVRQPFPSRALADGESEAQRLIDVFPTPDVRLRISFKQFVTADGDHGFVRVWIDPLDEDGTREYVQADGTWATTPAILRVPSSPWGVETFSLDLTEDFPFAGTLWIEGEGDDANDQTAIWDTTVLLIDDAGALITDYVVSVNNSVANESRGGAEVVTLERAPAVEVDTDGADDWQAPEDWTSTVYRDEGQAQPIAFSTLELYRASDLLNQRGRDLQAPACTVRGLHGPGRRLSFPTSLLSPGGTVTGTVPTIAGGGLALDLDRTETEGGFTEQTVTEPTVTAAGRITHTPDDRTTHDGDRRVVAL